jgi:hypothetical protein
MSKSKGEHCMQCSPILKYSLDCRVDRRQRLVVYERGAIGRECEDVANV